MPDQTKLTPTLLTDAKGKPSTMRALSFLSFFVAAALALGGVLGFEGAQLDNELVLFFLLGAFAPKAVQSFAENRMV